MINTVLIVQGLEQHWQSLWRREHPDYLLVEPRDLDRAIRQAEAEHTRVFIVAHGSGCIVALRRLAGRSADVAGALLVAPAWPFPPALEELPIPTTVVASRNDPLVPFHEAMHLARRLGSRFSSARQAGQIDGPWTEGERLLSKLMARSEARERDLLVGLALAG